jgi:HAD superfamily hydrolase (TIGR01509 family)
MLKAIIFDFDGLILETETPVFQSWQELYRKFDQELTFDTWQAAIGTKESSFNPYRELEKRTGLEINWDELEPRRARREYELADRQPLLPGVLDYLEQARQLGLRLGLASSSEREWVEYHLRNRDLEHYFSVVKCAEDVLLTKPDPALYLDTLSGLGVSALEAFALEDSPLGALAAKRAGLFCVVVPNNLTRQMKFEAGDLELDSLDSLPLTDLMSLVQEKMGTNGRVKS